MGVVDVVEVVEVVDVVDVVDVDVVVDVPLAQAEIRGTAVTMMISKRVLIIPILCFILEPPTEIFPCCCF